MTCSHLGVDSGVTSTKPYGLIKILINKGWVGSWRNRCREGWNRTQTHLIGCLFLGVSWSCWNWDSRSLVTYWEMLVSQYFLRLRLTSFFSLEFSLLWLLLQHNPSAHPFPGSYHLSQLPLLPLNTQNWLKCLLSQINKQNLFLWLLSPPVCAYGVSEVFSVVTQKGMATESLWPMLAKGRNWEQMVRSLNSIFDELTIQPLSLTINITCILCTT